MVADLAVERQVIIDVHVHHRVVTSRSHHVAAIEYTCSPFDQDKIDVVWFDDEPERCSKCSGVIESRGLADESWVRFRRQFCRSCFEAARHPPV